MKTDPRWSLTTTLAVNMLDLETKGGWVRYKDVVILIHSLEKEGVVMQKVDGHV